MQAAPIVRAKDTTPVGHAWLASGTVEFILGGEDAPRASLTFDFRNAQNEKAAIQQAADQLLQVAEAFSVLARQYLP
jgi:hypothetical protein